MFSRFNLPKLTALFNFFWRSRPFSGYNTQHMTRDKNYSIIDIETTGGSARNNKITEIAVINIDEGEIVERYSTLINPERSIPPQIQYLTGITNEMVQEAPKFFEVAKKIVELTEDRIFVAHNAHFDYSFVQNEFRELGYTYKKDLLCTVRLSRKLLPGHPSYSLGKLCDRLGIEIKDRHRAMGDADATAILFKMILDRMEDENSKEEFKKVYQGLNLKTNFPPHFNENDYDDLPNSPGVYYLWDKQGKLLYIGKAKDIKKRVRQHFNVKSSRTKEFEFKNNIANISFQETGNELAALLLEAQAIKEKSPIFNRALRRKKFPFKVQPYYDEDFVLQFRTASRMDELNCVARGSRRGCDSAIRQIYKKAFGIEPSLELHRSRELELILKALGKEKYNDRLKSVHDTYLYPQESFELDLPGRRPQEKCLIRRYEFGEIKVIYLKDGEVVESFKMEENPDLVKIVLLFLAKKDLKPRPLGPDY